MSVEINPKNLGDFSPGNITSCTLKVHRSAYIPHAVLSLTSHQIGFLELTINFMEKKYNQNVFLP